MLLQGDRFIDAERLIEMKSSRPLLNGLRVNQTVRMMPLDSRGKGVSVQRWEIEHAGRPVEYAGSLASAGLFTAPSMVPDPPWVRVNAYYLREGGAPGETAVVGRSFEIIPAGR